MSRASKAQDALQKKKEARQKKMLIGLAPILLILLAWQGPGTLKALTGGAEAETAPPPVSTSATVTTPDPATAAAPSTGAGAQPVTAPGATTPGATTPGATAPATGGATLPETTEPVSAGAGQLVSFDRFVGKDPFRQQVAAETADAPNGGGSKPPAREADAAGSDTAENPFTLPTSGGGGGSEGGGGTVSGPTATRAVFAVNGVRETVGLKGTFPADDPILRLVSGTAKSAKVALVSGQFSNGATTLTLKVGKSVTLVSQPDGIRYAIALVAVE